MSTVGAYEAKTRLPQLLREVGQGEVVTITRHGAAIARIVPVAAVSGDEALVDAFRAARAGVTRGDDSISSMVAEGRR
ncbi:type II toxin-antitoxin system Phd/YefM family antitoxin [Nocardioides stalactiti]|uniref:type II toxin-antitoxin system Phd/YefM family antitoxin n=1 Tax=Nocardioides stalactiti TaxID=2755356 RepID=UPI0015FFC597|nr:type II toxin-antitoxin system prevent-host-death family antitoxin [Nocardioides stalactiti]